MVEGTVVVAVDVPVYVLLSRLMFTCAELEIVPETPVQFSVSVVEVARSGLVDPDWNVPLQPKGESVQLETFEVDHATFTELVPVSVTVLAPLTVSVATGVEVEEVGGFFS